MALGVALAVVYAVELRVPRLFTPSATPIERFHGWRDAVAEVRQVVGEPAPFVAASNYQVAGPLAYYGHLRRFGPTYDRRSQFDIWNDAPAAGERVVMVGLRPPRPGVPEAILAGPTAPPAKVESFFAGVLIRTLWITMPRAAPGER